MIEILFRGKRVDNGELVDGDLIQNPDGTKYIGTFDAGNRFSDYIGFFVHPETVEIKAPSGEWRKIEELWGTEEKLRETIRVQAGLYNQESSKLKARIEKLGTALRFFSILNPEYYKDIAGGIKKAKELLNG